MAQGIDLGLGGRSAIVCGSSAGLGLACATALARAGADVTINGREPARLARAAERILADTGRSVIAVAADVTTPEGRAKLLEGREPDILVNNAAGPPPGDIRGWSHEAWMAAINDNMMAAIHLTIAAIDGMIARRWGRVINITSGAVKAVMPRLGLSTAARAGLTGFAAALAREVAPHGVTVNNLLPGLFETDRMRAYISGSAVSPLASIPTGEAGAPEDFGVWCAFIASHHSGYITGQNILLDGGAFPSVM